MPLDENRLREAALELYNALVDDSLTTREGWLAAAEPSIRALVREAVRECEEIAKRKHGEGDPPGPAIRERFAWLDAGSGRGE